jgi:hypothetical protein
VADDLLRSPAKAALGMIFVERERNIEGKRLVLLVPYGGKKMEKQPGVPPKTRLVRCRQCNLMFEWDGKRDVVCEKPDCQDADLRMWQHIAEIRGRPRDLPEP